MSLPEVVSRDEWLVARKALLAKEKALTRARDALNTERRELPMVRIDKDYVFDGPAGKARLLDLFEGRSQLVLGHFMFDPSWDAGCSSCSAGADEVSDGLIRHLNTRDTSLAFVSRAPLAKIEAYKATKGWTFPWYSSHGSDFNYDFHATLDPSVTPAEYNYSPVENAEPGEAPGQSIFLRDGDEVFHTYSSYARGAEATGGSYYYLDLTPLGRQEDWELPKDRTATARTATPNFES
ncbi:DUF899 domain-containing protein [Umezawaea sp. NPDC059074]|uniref:DUF899 domain-containing protein n=1 Tax=Umezawaea sp. NPDC059074 TaxID=3346716 RepID=UPI0036C5F917